MVEIVWRLSLTIRESRRLGTKLSLEEKIRKLHSYDFPWIFESLSFGSLTVSRLFLLVYRFLFRDSSRLSPTDPPFF